MAEKVDLQIKDMAVESLPPLGISSEMLAELDADAGPDDSGPAEQDAPPPVTVTAAQVASFLRITYQTEGILSRYPDLWIRDDSWFDEIAAGITPNVNTLCERVPMVGHAIKAVDAAGCWGRLVWDQAITWYLTWAKRQEARAQAQREEGDHGQPADTPNPFRVDYSGAIQPGL